MYLLPSLEDTTDLNKLLLAALVSGLVNFGRKWLTDTTGETPDTKGGG